MKIGLEKKPHQELLPTSHGAHDPLSTLLGVQHSPQSHCGQLALFTLATWGQKGSFALPRFYTQIYFVFNEPFSINVILTAK